MQQDKYVAGLTMRLIIILFWTGILQGYFQLFLLKQNILSSVTCLDGCIAVLTKGWENWLEWTCEHYVPLLDKWNSSAGSVCESLPALTSQYLEETQSGHGKVTKQMWECLDKAEPLFRAIQASQRNSKLREPWTEPEAQPCWGCVWPKRQNQTRGEWTAAKQATHYEFYYSKHYWSNF